MTNPETQDSQTDAEAQAVQEALVGYQGTARAQAPAQPEEGVDAGQPLADSATDTAAPDEGSEVEEANPPAEPARTAAEDVLTHQLEDLKAQVKALAANSPNAEAVRKMHGEIGNINRTLKQLATSKEDAPADEMADALAQADLIAQEFPDIAGPLVKAIKVLQSRMPKAPEPQHEEEPETPAEPAAAPAVDAEQERMQAAIKALDEVHPDRHQIKDSEAFRKWFATWKTPEDRKKAVTSWNPAVVAQPFSDFKAWASAQQRRKDRLDAAATPQGVTARAGTTQISDEEAARRGYDRARAKRL
jgi:hypothetical protein